MLRRGLEALEQRLTDPSLHPALRIAGILDTSGAVHGDAARDHDRILVEAEEESWAEDPGG